MTSPAPMHPTCQIATKELIDEIQLLVGSRDVPSLESYRNSFRIDDLEILQSPGSQRIQEMTENLAASIRPPQKGLAAKYLKQWQLIMANLCRATAVNQWVGVSGDKKAFKAGSYLSQLGLSHEATQRILNRLVYEGLIIKVQGKRFRTKPITNQYFPSKALQLELAASALYTANNNSFAKPFLGINEPDPGYESFHWDRAHPDRIPLEEINEFARHQSWACKSSIRQVFRHTPFQSGRLITPFQNLQNRTYKIRTKTLINGNSIAEIDFNANHFRIFLAMNKTDVIGGSDAYISTVAESGVDRSKVKRCINIALNTDSEGSAASAALNEGISTTEFRAVNAALKKLYPDLGFHAQQALAAMQLEGMILRTVMRKGVEAGVFCLPIHDAIAVEQTNVAWAIDAMEESWEHWIRHWHPEARTFTSVTYGTSTPRET